MPHADDATQPPSMADVFRDNATFVMRVVRRMGVPPGDVEDVAQEVFVLVQQKLAQYDPRRPLRPWLFGIASRMAVGHLRRAQATRARHAAAEPPQPLCADPLHAAEYSQARQMLERALDSLDQVKREVFVAFDLEGLPMSQVAAMQECPLQTAYARLHAARKSVQQFVARTGAVAEASHG